MFFLWIWSINIRQRMCLHTSKVIKLSKHCYSINNNLGLWPSQHNAGMGLNPSASQCLRTKDVGIKFRACHRKGHLKTHNQQNEDETIMRKIKLTWITIFSVNLANSIFFANPKTQKPIFWAQRFFFSQKFLLFWVSSCFAKNKKIFGSLFASKLRTAGSDNQTRDVFVSEKKFRKYFCFIQTRFILLWKVKI